MFEGMDQDEAMLAELAGLDMALARCANAAALDAHSEGRASDFNELSRTYLSAARSLRQTLALRSRLRREHLRTAREARTAAARQIFIANETRRNQVRVAVEGAIWAEHETHEAERLERVLEDLLDDDIILEDDDFARQPFDDHVRRIALAIGVTPPEGAGQPEETEAARTRSPPPDHPGEASAPAVRPAAPDPDHDWAGPS